MTRDRRGFTLIELLIVTVLGALVLAAALQVLVTNQRTYTAQSAAITGQQATRTALEVLFNDLRLLSPASGDILMMHQDSLRVRMMRKFSRTCQTTNLMDPGNPRAIILDVGPTFPNPSPIDFKVGDSVFVFADRKQTDDDDDIWISARITQVAPGVCPQVGTPVGWEIAFAGQQNLFDVPDSVHIGAPVRSFNSVRFGLTPYNGDLYLGRADSTDVLQPIAGPLLPGTGLEFVYRDAMGVVTATPADVRQIVVRIRSESSVLNSLGEMVSDSITAWVYSRN